ncbi:MAG: Gp138 family membrane-puncturing spike protein [Aeromonadaceae bacterium]
MADMEKTEITDSELLDEVINQALLMTRTIMIAECVSFDESRNTVDVQPVLKRKFSNKPEASLAPIIRDVPVAFYGAGGVTVTYKPVAGDNCILMVSDRAIDAWKKLGGIVDPAKPRHHDMSDAVAYFGLNAFPQAYKNLRGGMDVRTRDGSTSLNVLPGSIVATVGGTKVATMTSSKVVFDVPIEAPKVKAAGKELDGHDHNYTDDGASKVTGANN